MIYKNCLNFIYCVYITLLKRLCLLGLQNCNKKLTISISNLTPTWVRMIKPHSINYFGFNFTIKLPYIKLSTFTRKISAFGLCNFRIFTLIVTIFNIMLFCTIRNAWCVWILLLRGSQAGASQILIFILVLLISFL